MKVDLVRRVYYVRPDAALANIGERLARSLRTYLAKYFYGM